MFRLKTGGALLIAVALATNCADDESTRPDAPLGPSAQVEEAIVAASIPLLVVNSPASIAGSYAVGTASFGPPLTPAGVTGDVILALDAADASGPSMTDACSPLTNVSEVVGRIALVDRGTCTFTIKVKNAQNAGAIAVIVVDNQPGPPAGMGGVDPTITIPSVRISQADGNLIKAQLANTIVNATLLVALPAVLDVNPGNINLNSKGNYVTVYIESSAFDVAQIDVATVTLQAIDPATSAKLPVASGSPTALGDGNGNGVLDRMVKFDRATVQSWFTGDAQATLRVEGKLFDRSSFAGDDAVQVSSKGSGRAGDG